VLTVTGFVTGVNTLGWSNLGVASGGTGVTTMTYPYGMLCAGTTSTGALQCMPTGSAGQICVSGGSSAMPSWSSATVDTNGNISCANVTSSNAYIMSIDYISTIVLSQFTNVGSYPTYPYTYSANGIVYGYIFDITGITGPTQYVVYLPTGFTNDRAYIWN